MGKPYTAKSIVSQLEKYPEFSKEKIRILIENCVTNCLNENGVVPPEQLRMITILVPLTYTSVITNGGQTDQAERAAASIANELPKVVKKYIDRFNQTNRHSSKDIVNLISDLSNSIGNVAATDLTGLETKVKEKISSLISTAVRFLSYIDVKPKGKFRIKWLDIENDISGGWSWSDVGETVFKWGVPIGIGLATLGAAAAMPGLAPVAGTVGSLAYQTWNNNQTQAAAQAIADENAVFNTLNSTMGVGTQPDLSGLSMLNATLPSNMTVPSNISLPANMTVPTNMTLPSNMLTPPNMTLPSNMTFGNNSTSSNMRLPSDMTFNSTNRYSPVNTTVFTPLQAPASVPINNNTVTVTPFTNQTTPVKIINPVNIIQDAIYKDRITDQPLEAIKIIRLMEMNKNEWIDYVKSRGNKLTVDEVNAHYHPPQGEDAWKALPYNDIGAVFGTSDMYKADLLRQKGEELSKYRNLENPLTDEQKKFIKSMSNSDWGYYKSLRGNELSRDEIVAFNDRRYWPFRTTYGRNAVRDFFKSVDYTPEIDRTVIPPPEQSTESSMSRYTIFNPNTGESETVMSKNGVDIEERINRIPGIQQNTVETAPDEDILEQVKEIRKKSENKSLNEQLTGQDPGKYEETNTENIDIKHQQPTYERTSEPSSMQTDKTPSFEKQPELFPNTNDNFNMLRIERSVNTTDGSVRFSITPDNIEGYNGESELTIKPNGDAVYTIPKDTSVQEFTNILNAMNSIKPASTPAPASSILWTGLQTVLGVVGLPITAGIYLVKGAYAIDPVLGQFVMMSMAPSTPFLMKMVYKIYAGFFNTLNSRLNKSDKKVMKGLYNFNTKIGGYIDDFLGTFSEDDVKALGNVLSQTVPAMIQDYMAIKQKTAIYNQQVNAYKQKEAYTRQRAQEKKEVEQRRIDIENQNIDLENARALRSNREERERAQLRNANKIEHYKEDLEEYNNILDYNAASDLVKMKNAELVHKWDAESEKTKNEHNKYNALISACENGLQAIGDVAKSFSGFKALETGTDMLKDLSSTVSQKLFDSKKTLALAQTYAKSAGEAYRNGNFELGNKFFDEGYKYERRAREMFDDSMKYNDRIIARRQEEIGKKYGFFDGFTHKLGDVARGINDYVYWQNQKTRPVEEFLSTRRPPEPRKPDLEVVPEDISKQPGLLKRHLPDAADVLPEYIGPPPTMPLDMYSMPQTMHVFRDVLPAEKRRIEEKKMRDQDILAYLKSMANSNKSTPNLIVNPGPHTRGLQTRIQPMQIVKNQPTPLRTRTAVKKPLRIVKASRSSLLPSKRRRF